MSDDRRQSREAKPHSSAPPDGNGARAGATFGLEWNPDTDQVIRSPDSAAMLGAEPVANWSEHLAHIPAPDRQKLEALLADLTPLSPTYRIGYRYLTPSGKELVLEEHGWAEFDPAQRPIRRRGIAADVTARTQGHEELQQREKCLRLALTAARGGTWLLDPTTGDCTVSNEARELLRLPGDAPCTLQAILRQVHPGDRPRVRACLETAIRETAAYRLELRIPLPGGNTRWLSAQGEPFAAASGQRQLLGLILDISEHKSGEEALRVAGQRKDDLLGMVAHELRNPLTPVRNAAELLRRIDSDDPRLRETARMIERQTAHMERLIEDLLDVTRIASGRLELRRETAPLADILAQALELSKPRIEERGQNLRFGSCADSIILNCDRLRLCQVFANLLDNAAKYTDEGDDIRLQVRVQRTEVIVRISDSGRGIAVEELPHLFEGLARKRPRPAPPLAGLGLGLSIVKRLVEMHGGSVWAESPGIGQGSSFSVRLPLFTGQDSASSATADRSRLRILVVDDDRDIAESTGLLLQSLGHEVDLASSAEEALSLAARQQHRLVLLDIGLGSSNGLDVARRLRQLPHGRNMHIAAVTGRGDSRTRREVRAAGIDRHLLKPLSLNALQELLGSLHS